jgi:SpoVK/Ycf46/Vps4 family AAA+-type ATPase
LVSDREKARGGAGMTNQMLIQLQSIFIVAATNRPNTIDEAFGRRFDRLIYIPLPKTCQERSAIGKFHLMNTNHILLDRDFYFIGSVTDGFSPADLELIVKKQKMKLFHALSVKTVTEKPEKVCAPCPSTRPCSCTCTS